MEQYRNEMLDELVGGLVAVTKQATRPPDQEEVNQMVENPTISVRRPLRAEVALQVLESYDQLGVILQTGADPPSRYFVPWSAVIHMSKAV
jgi:hypothetical protein